MKELRKRFLVGMITGILIFTGGLGVYQILTTEVLDDIKQVSELKQMIRQAGEMAKTSNKNVINISELIRI